MTVVTDLLEHHVDGEPGVLGSVSQVVLWGVDAAGTMVTVRLTHDEAARVACELRRVARPREREVEGVPGALLPRGDAPFVNSFE